MTVAHFNVDQHFQAVDHIAAFPFIFEWRNCHILYTFKKISI